MTERIVTVDFSKKCGKIKPLGGVCLGPRYDISPTVDLSEEYREIGVPIVRTAKRGVYEDPSRALDIKNIFPDPMLDERFFGSYNFSAADAYLTEIKKSGAEIFLRLGESIDKYAPFPTRPHVSAEKWAEIAVRIILHYNKGWAGGFKYSIKYVEIWPFADSHGAFADSPEEFYEFYRVVASRIKEAFPSIKVGGYSSGGFSALNRYDASREEKKYVEFLEGFLRYISAKNSHAPLDFLTWECRAESAEELSLHSNYAKNFLVQFGFRRTLCIVSDFSVEIYKQSSRLSRHYPAQLCASLIAACDANIDMMFYTGLHPYLSSNAVIGLDDCESLHRYAAFGVLSAFGDLFRAGTEVATTDNFRREVYTVAAASEELGAVLIATGNYSGTVVITLKSCPFTSYSVKGMIGGGKRGAGFSTSQENIPLSKDTLSIKVGKDEIYQIILS